MNMQTVQMKYWRSTVTLYSELSDDAILDQRHVHDIDSEVRYPNPFCNVSPYNMQKITVDFYFMVLDEKTGSLVQHRVKEDCYYNINIGSFIDLEACELKEELDDE